jgi:hypothetical protein
MLEGENGPPAGPDATSPPVDDTESGVTLRLTLRVVLPPLGLAKLTVSE